MSREYDLKEFVPQIMPRTGVVYFVVAGVGYVCKECGYIQDTCRKVVESSNYEHSIFLRETHDPQCSAYEK